MFCLIFYKYVLLIIIVIKIFGHLSLFLSIDGLLEPQAYVIVDGGVTDPDQRLREHYTL